MSTPENNHGGDPKEKTFQDANKLIEKASEEAWKSISGIPDEPTAYLHTNRVANHRKPPKTHGAPENKFFRLDQP